MLYSILNPTFDPARHLKVSQGNLVAFAAVLLMPFNLPPDIPVCLLSTSIASVIRIRDTFVVHRILPISLSSDCAATHCTQPFLKDSVLLQAPGNAAQTGPVEHGICHFSATTFLHLSANGASSYLYKRWQGGGMWKEVASTNGKELGMPGNEFDPKQAGEC